MMKKKLISIVTSALLICALTACQGIPGMTQQGSNSTTTVLEDSTPEESEEPEEPIVELSEEKEQELYNLYVDTYNHMIGRLYDSIDKYFEHVAFEEEFSLIDDYYCYSISGTQVKKAEDAYALASSKTEKSALDEAFLAMYPSLSTVMDTLVSMYDYYDLKSYVDDDYAKAEEYHAALWSALAEYEATGTVFMEELDVVARERQAESLQMMQEEGYIVFYNINMMFNCAAAIQDELYEQGITDENLIEMDLEPIQPLYDEFIGYVEEILSYQDDSEQLQYEGIPEHSAYWSTFLMALKDTKVSLTGIIQRVEEQKPLSSFDLNSPSILTGRDTITSFDTGVSKMINDYNTFIQY